MAAIAQSEPFSVFIRKIGWSVGLEHTFARVEDLLNLYVEQREISPSAWSRLVSDEANGWGLKTTHIADFFASIQLIKAQKREIHVLPCLDSLALARIEIVDDLRFKTAFNFILASQIVLSDGDIFLNFLLGDFVRKDVETLLREMILKKRSKLIAAMKAPQLAERLIRAISIDIQPNNTGGAAVGKSLSEKKRVAPLAPRVGSLSSRPDIEKIEISDDYFRKVTGRRKDWARSLELIDENLRLTDSGKRLTESIRKLMDCEREASIACWPLAHELERIHLFPEKLLIPEISLWDHILAIASGYTQKIVGDVDSSAGADEVLTLLKRMQSSYRNLCPRRELLRREIPLSVFLHSVAAYFIAMQKPLPNLPSLLRVLLERSDSEIIYRRSKNFEATLSIKS